MKIHKINLENYYRNLMMESLKLSGATTSYTPYPQYTEVAFTCNVNDTVTIGIPSLPASIIQKQTASGMWETPVQIEYATATIVGLTSDKSIPLGEFSLQQDANRIFWRDNSAQDDPTLNLFTIPAGVDKLKVVISFKSGHTVRKTVGGRIRTVWEDLVSNDSIEAMTVNIKREDNSGSSPVSFVDYDETGSGDVTKAYVDQQIATLQAEIGTINDTLNNVLHG